MQKIVSEWLMTLQDPIALLGKCGFTLNSFLLRQESVFTWANITILGFPTAEVNIKVDKATNEAVIGPALPMDQQ